ncbi:MAG: mechanosensitive ion channel domain-containing protein, partial [Candidatus Babeliales bacterium]
MKRYMILVWMAILTSTLRGSLVDFDVTKKLMPSESSQKIFTTIIEERQNRLAELQEEQAKLTQAHAAVTSKIKDALAEVSSQLGLIKDALRNKPDDGFLNKKLVPLNEDYQVLKDLQRTREQLSAVIDQHIKLLQDYLKDPEFKHFKKELKIGQQTGYTFEDLQVVSRLINEQQKTMQQLAEQEKNAHVEFENRKRTVTATSEFYKKKQAQTETYHDSFDMNVQQRMELAQFEERLFNDKRERDALLLKEIEYKRAFIRTELFIARLQLDILRECFKAIKPAIKVSEADVSYAKDELAKKRQQAFETKEAYRKEVEIISEEKKEKEHKLEELSKRNSIAVGLDIDEWTREPIKTISGHVSFFEVADLNDHILLIQRKKDLFEAQMSLEDEKIRQETIHIGVKHSFYKIVARKFSVDDEIKQEVKSYDAPKAETKANLSLFKERKNGAQHHLNQQKKALENVLERRRNLHDQRNGLFKGHVKEYMYCIELLNNAEATIKQQIDILNKIINIYADIIVMLKKTAKQIDFIRSELESITIWYRPEHAISWEGVQGIIPSVVTFGNDLMTYLKNIDFYALIERARTTIQYPWVLLLFLFNCLLFMVGAGIVKRMLPHLIKTMHQLRTRYPHLTIPLLIGTLVCGYLLTYYDAWVIWVGVWLFLRVYEFADPYPYIVFYLASIPYLLYLAQSFFAYVEEFNAQHNSFLMRTDFHRRLVVVGATLVYTTLVLSLFREAFILASYHKSEVPTILLALNFIIFQIALICLIDKKQVLSLIPRSYDLGNWLHMQIDKYYYPITALVIAIIVLSNPYIGFGKLVLFIISRLMYTALVLPLLFWIHKLLKKSASYIFFYGEEGVMRERFDYAKTLYGIFVIGIFLSFMMGGGIFLAKIWGWPDKVAHISHWSDIVEWLKTPIILERTEHPISVYSLLKIVTFIMAGFGISYVLNRVILSRIFDVLLVDSGVQNTVASLTRYLIIITTVILGFQSVGLGELVVYLLGALIVGIGWVIKDPIGDFIAYFVILVQRPVKIGDYITLDEETKGVVRKITARSVVIRRKNSTTVIVPNSTIIKKPLANWNYARGFIAFDDIIVTVTYQADPAHVKSLLEKVVESSPFVLKSPKPIVRLDNFSDLGFVFMVRGFLSANYTLDQWDIASDIRLEIVKVLRANNIQLAVPVRIMVSKNNSSQHYTGTIDEPST